MTTPPPDQAQPGFLALLRQLERKGVGKPRIGRNQRLQHELVRLGQDPFLAFPDSDLSAVDMSQTPPQVRARFMGYFGPHGALPLNTTEEVFQWLSTGDRAFVAFTDIFASRFIQLYYRSWADARAITQFDHPDDDRFQKYLLSFAGMGTDAFRNQSEIADTLCLRFVSLFFGRVKSPVKLRQMLTLHLSYDITVEEMVPSWMAFEPDTLSRLGQMGSTLGQDMHLGSRIQSIGEKIMLHVRVDTIAAYRRFLPGGTDYTHLESIVFSYLGHAFEVDLALWLPQREVPAAKLGATAELGWMACVAPPPGGDHYVRGTTFRLDRDQTGAMPLAA
jgi:type VI secretion system protein ImpH